MYFAKEGPANTEQTIQIALQAAKEQDIRHIVVASNSGETALRLAGCGRKVVCVTEINTPITDEMRGSLAGAGIKVLTTTHILSGAERGLSRKFGGVYPVEIMAHTMRMFGQGMKVCLEIATMALDCLTIPKDERIIVLGGTHRGCDTAVVMTPAHSSAILETKIHQILCKPELN